MASVPNQQSYKTHKAACDKDNLYATINIKAINAAMRDLKPQTFKVWLVYAKNQDGYEFIVSPAAIQQEWGIPVRSVQEANRALKDLGYLIETSPNHFDFYEVARPDLKPEAQKPMAITKKAMSDGFEF